MQGFFTRKDTQFKGRTHKTTAGCGSCRLYKTCKSPRMKVGGKGKKKILIIGEAPSEKDDLQGTQFVGRTGVYLAKELKRLGIDLHKDCWKINAVNCRLPKNRKPNIPSEGEIEACRPLVFKAITECKPKVIVVLGMPAVQTLFDHRYHKALNSLIAWRGWCVPDRELGAWICPTYHPNFLMRKETVSSAGVIFRNDLKQAIKKTRKDLPTFDREEEQVRTLFKAKDIEKYLRGMLRKEPGLVAFDYETTGLKPHAKGHKIVSCAFAGSRTKATAFPLLDENKATLKKILTNKSIGKSAANLKFEETWTRVLLGYKIRGWKWDTMIAAHCLNNAPKITSLKFQACVRYGVFDYDSHIEPYLKATDGKSDNSLNTIHKVKMEDLLIYNGIDALLEYRLTKDQMKELK